MRVLLLTTGLNVGGIETNMVRLARELSLRGHTVLVASGGGSLTDALLSVGAIHVDLRMSPRNPLAVLRDVLSLRRTIRGYRPDVTHVFSASGAALLWLARRGPPGYRARRTASPVVSSIMGLANAPSEPTWRVMVRAYATTLGADRVVAIAPAIEQILHQLPIDRRRIDRRPLVGVEMPSSENVEVDQRGRVRAHLGVVGDERVVMTVGGLDRRKSHELFLQAAALLAARRTDTRFFVVGEGGLRSDLEKEARRLGIGDRTRFLGERSDVLDLLSATDVYVRPGIVEGFVGITVLEAQSLNVPVVSFETEDVKLAITDGETGLLVPRGHVGALSEAVGELLDNPERARRIGRAGRAHVERTFGLAAVVGGIEELYEQVIEDQRRQSPC